MTVDEAFRGQWMDGEGAIVVINNSSVRLPDGKVCGVDPKDRNTVEITWDGHPCQGKLSRDGMWLLWSHGDTWIRVQDEVVEEKVDGGFAEQRRGEIGDQLWCDLSADAQSELQGLGYTPQSWDAELRSAQAGVVVETQHTRIHADDVNHNSLQAENADDAVPDEEAAVPTESTQQADATVVPDDISLVFVESTGAEAVEAPAHVPEVEASEVAPDGPPAPTAPQDGRHLPEPVDGGVRPAEVAQVPNGVMSDRGRQVDKAEHIGPGSEAETETADDMEQRLVFPAGFIWGSGTAAYQIEGGVAEGGRTPSIWDTFAAKPGKVRNGDTGAVACDHYHRWREDVCLMKELGLPAYRFSISWSRLLPKGRGEPNPQAVAFYGGLLDELIVKGIKPVVTIYHWDLPQCLEDEYGGWLGRQVVEDFEAYAAACFAAFGDRVDTWITFNEPWCSAVLGYSTGEMAPGRSQAPEREPYTVAHHIILAHASAVRRYREDFQGTQSGQIGMTLNVDWKEPLSASPVDVAAQGRALDWQLGWFADPIWKGDYPRAMRQRCGERLPKFSEAEKKLVQQTADFFGLNHYTTTFTSPLSGLATTISKGGGSDGWYDDREVQEKDDPAWARTDMDWGVVPWGLKHLCKFIQDKYAPSGGILVMENGCAVKEERAEVAKEDALRVEYLQGYIAQLHLAIQDGADVRGYFVWSFLDNYEWHHGYSKRFGIVRVDYETQERTIKASGRLMSNLAATNSLKIGASKLRASRFTPIEYGEKALEDQDSRKSSQPAKARTRLEGILKELSVLRQRLVMLQSEEPFLVGDDGRLVDSIAEEAQGIVQAAEVLAPVHPATVTVHHDMDAFSEDNAHEEKVDNMSSREDRAMFGVNMCSCLGLGGFVMFDDTLYFRAHLPDSIEGALRPAPGCTLVTVRRAAQPLTECSIVPMGQFAITTSFLQHAGWRHQAFPLDWSAATFKAWQHMFQDNFATLLRSPEGEKGPHPYEGMFSDTRMFPCQGGWANAAVHRRVARLQALLERGRAFGFAMYFDREGGARESLNEIAADARDLAAGGHGFCHIVVVWLERPQGPRPSATWWAVGDAGSCSILQYSPSRPLSCQEELPPEDSQHVAELLEERFPHAFTRKPGVRTGAASLPPPTSEQDMGRRWISVDHARRSSERAGGNNSCIWTVTGAFKLGAVVRKERSLKSAELGRLGSGAKVRELDLDGERLHYEKIEGHGPSLGWVSIRSSKGVDLLVRVEE